MLHHEGMGIPTLYSSFLRRERRIIYNIVHRKKKMRQKTNNEQEELNIEYVNIK